MSLVALLVAITIGTASASAGEHLLAGATAFREGRLAEALVEFRVAERLGADEAGPYAGAALVKLGRPEEAVEAFGLAPASGEDALLAYYRALALRGAGLLLSAQVALDVVDEHAGPRVAAEAARLRAEIAAALGKGPAPSDVDVMLARAASLRARGRVVLATASYAEAAALARRAGSHRLDEAVRASAELSGRSARSAP